MALVSDMDFFSIIIYGLKMKLKPLFLNTLSNVFLFEASINCCKMSIKAIICLKYNGQGLIYNLSKQLDFRQINRRSTSETLPDRMDEET